ncbi:hypothetical protein G6F68_014964 [Rhizopus microsporus]|nr:hypothetical protein G6F68_014964 [Rhizopus microsporus]
MRRKETQGVVTPVIAQATFQQEPVLQEGVHRQQFDRGDAQAVQVFDEPWVGQRRAGAAQGLAQVFALHRHAAQMHFVDRRVYPWRLRRLAVAPVERDVFRHDGLGHGRRAVAAVHRQVGARVVQPVAEERVAPARRAGQVARTRPGWASGR